VTTRQPIKVLAELRDLQIVDSEDQLCGIVDEVEFEGEPGKSLRVSALLVGPGAYRGRLPGWLAAIVRWIAGERIIRVPWQAVEHVTSRITLNRTAEDLGLNAVERRLAARFPKIPAL
jgi:sporulation protein YlmC with PRC-barrel domain